MAIFDDGFDSLSDLSRWFKVQSGDELTLVDVPEIISLRFNFFLKDWDRIKKDLRKKLLRVSDPEALENAILRFSDFIEDQRSIATGNPLTDRTTKLRFYHVFNNLSLNSLPINRREREIITDKIVKTRRFTKTDFRDMRRPRSSSPPW